MLRGLILTVALWAVPWSAGAEEALGTITILEGDALVYRGAGRVYGAEGMRVAPGDIVHSGDKTFMQIEFADKTVAQLGPSSRLLVSSGRRKGDHGLYLMDGWAKITGVKAAAGDAGWDLRTPLVELGPSPAVVVVRGTPSEVTLFVERGEARVVERPSNALALKGGDTYRRKAGARGSVASGVAAAFAAEMPRAFRDSLPSRIERYRERPTAPRNAPGFGYDDIEPWLNAEPAVRRPLMPRWRAKAREPAFRSALIANLSSHPEWDPILFPEKYLPKNPASAAAVSKAR